MSARRQLSHGRHRERHCHYRLAGRPDSLSLFSPFGSAIIQAETRGNPVAERQGEAMPYELVAEKIAKISPEYQGELLQFIDFLLFRQGESSAI
jgi:hypothetical protein